MSDVELEVLKRKKLKELEMALKAQRPPPETKAQDPFEVVYKHLVGRGREVLDAARIQYPQETATVVTHLAQLIEKNKIKEPMTGEQLFGVFRKLGIPVRLETRIVFEEHGKVKSLAEKLRENGL
jgi:DNA-binding TFAR19-related protein (PDSD5 family)